MHYITVPTEMNSPSNTKIRTNWWKNFAILLMASAIFIFPAEIMACYTQSQIDQAYNNALAATAADISASLALAAALSAVPVGWLLVASAAAAVASAVAWEMSAWPAYNDAAADPCCA